MDPGEASVIHNAFRHHVSLVAIDEKAGRRVARLHGLSVTGSLGILIRAKKEGLVDDLEHCIQHMTDRGIWISDALVTQALEISRERGA